MPILCLAGHVIAHDHIDVSNCSALDYTLFTLEENTIVSAFRLSNYVKARFAPQKKWDCMLLWLIIIQMQ